MLISALFMILLALSILLINYSTTVLFQDRPWILAISVSLGILTGTLRAFVKIKSGPADPSGLIMRHTVDSFVEHWGTASGILLLLISGFLLIFGLSRFEVNLHFIGLFVTLLCGSYFLADFFLSQQSVNLLPNLTDIIDGTLKKYLLRIKSSEKGKYLSSQKSSFFAFATLGIGITITGVIKLAGVIWSIPAELIQISTSVHDILAYLFAALLVVHVTLTLSVRSYRRLIRSWFTGTD